MAACPHSAPAHFLIAGSSADLPSLRSAVEQLPDDAYGQVVVEADEDCLPNLPVPPGVTTTVLIRRASTGEARGERVAQAVQAWISEWMCEDEPDAPRVIWLGGLSCEPIMRLHSDLRERFPRLHEHRSA